MAPWLPRAEVVVEQPDRFGWDVVGCWLAPEEAKERRRRSQNSPGASGSRSSARSAGRTPHAWRTVPASQLPPGGLPVISTRQARTRPLWRCSLTPPADAGTRSTGIATESMGATTHLMRRYLQNKCPASRET
jgi:hypothetical protein